MLMTVKQNDPPPIVCAIVWRLEQLHQGWHIPLFPVTFSIQKQNSTVIKFYTILAGVSLSEKLMKGGVQLLYG